MRFTTQKIKRGEFVFNYQKVEMTEEEFCSFILDCLKVLLKDWREVFQNYFERVIVDGFDVDCLEVNINGKCYKMKNEREFIKVVHEVYGDIGLRILEKMKGEIIKKEQNTNI